MGRTNILYKQTTKHTNLNPTKLYATMSDPQIEHAKDKLNNLIKYWNSHSFNSDVLDLVKVIDKISSGSTIIKPREEYNGRWTVRAF